MTSTTTSPPTLLGLLDELYRGRVRWDLLRPFPEPDATDRADGDAAVATLRDLLREHADPEAIDREGRLPGTLVELLRSKGYFGLTIAPEDGGMGLSGMNAVRVVETAASWSTAVGWMLAITNGLGSGNYLPLMAEGPLREMVLQKVRGAALSGSADTESGGAANRGRDTTAVPVDDGSAYLINGEKIFIGNAPLAEVVDVSATVEHPDGRQIRIFFLRLDSPGVEVVTRQEFMGLRGASIGVLRFTDVRVPAEQLLPISADEWRDEPELVRIAVLGRMLIIASPSLAIAKLCLTWARNFVNRRSMDDRPLAEYDEIQRLVAQNAADVFALESVVEWCMLSGDLAELTPELTAAKNLTSLTCWQVVDRTLSLMGGEGFETARSKAARGAPPLPVERFARDARGLRVAGGVDFLLDYWSGLAALDGYEPGADADLPPTDPPLTDPALSPRCLEHLGRLQSESAALAGLCRRLVTAYDAERLAAREHEVLLAGQLGGTLMKMAVTLARAAHLAERGNTAALELADIVCTEAGHQLAGLWARLAEESHPDYAATSERALKGGELDFLLHDVITDVPPTPAWNEGGEDR